MSKVGMCCWNAGFWQYRIDTEAIYLIKLPRIHIGYLDRIVCEGSCRSKHVIVTLLINDMVMFDTSNEHLILIQWRISLLVLFSLGTFGTLTIENNQAGWPMG